MRIGYRTIKTAIGVPVAISIAQLIGINHFISAGILTMLCIQPTRRRSFISARDRFFACLIGITFSYLLFESLGYFPAVIGLLLIVFIPVTVFFNISQGIITSTVIVLNLYNAGNITFPRIGEQLLIILIGIGTALILNIYMPSLDQKLRAMQKEVERNFQKVLSEIALYIRDKDRAWDGKELIVAEDILNEATKLVSLDRENQVLRSEHTYYDYFAMRKEQYKLLRRMMPLVSRIENIELISSEIADYFERLSESVHPGNTAILFLDELNQLRDTFQTMELPTTREEFETRANLFRLLHEIEDYLVIKNNFKESDISFIRNQKKKTKKA